MLKRLAIYVFVVVVAVCAMELMAAQDKKAAQDSAGEQKQLLPTINETSNCAPAQQKEQSTEKVQWWNKFFTWPEGITAWVLIFTLIAIASQAILMRVHAKHLRSLAEHITTSERAWVLVCKVSPVAGAIDRPEGSKQGFVCCEAKNFGKTPARVLGFNALFAEGPITDPEKTWDERLYDFSGKTVPKWTIVPGIPKPLHEPVPGFSGGYGDHLPALDKGRTHFIHGVIRYWDGFGETDRFTRFCYRWDNEHLILGKGWNIAGGERCNQET